MAGSIACLAVRHEKALHTCLRVPACSLHARSERPARLPDRISRRALHETFHISLAKELFVDDLRSRSLLPGLLSPRRRGGNNSSSTTSNSCSQPSARFLQLSSHQQYQAKLAPNEVTNILRANEYTHTDLPPGPVKSFDMNTLQSNNPIEDAHAEALLANNGGVLFGIFDGHGGAACGQVVAKRLLHYIAAGLLSVQDLEKHIEAFSSGSKEKAEYHLLTTYNDHFELVQDLKELYRISYQEYLTDLLRDRTGPGGQSPSVEDVLVNAFTRLDDDMSREAIPKPGGLVNMKTLTVAMSGCVACVAHVDGPNLHVASTGDCTAVIGSLSDTDTWVAKKLTHEHNSDNQNEVKRILSEHPESEHHQIIKGDRLLSYSHHSGPLAISSSNGTGRRLNQLLELCWGTMRARHITRPRRT